MDAAAKGALHHDRGLARDGELDAGVAVGGARDIHAEFESDDVVFLGGAVGDLGVEAAQAIGTLLGRVLVLDVGDDRHLLGVGGGNGDVAPGQSKPHGAGLGGIGELEVGGGGFGTLGGGGSREVGGASGGRGRGETEQRGEEADGGMHRREVKG